MHVLAVPQFKKQFGKLSVELKRRVVVATRAISESFDLASLGVRKGISCVDPGRLRCLIFAYGINQSYGLLHCVGTERLTFVGAGDRDALCKKG